MPPHPTSNKPDFDSTRLNLTRLLNNADRGEIAQLVSVMEARTFIPDNTDLKTTVADFIEFVFKGQREQELYDYARELVHDWDRIVARFVPPALTASISSLSPQSPVLLQSAAPSILLPPSPSRYFIGRIEALVQLETYFAISDLTVKTQAITGLGGIGKTQLAIQYSERYQNDYATLFWITATSEIAIENAFCQIATAVFGGDWSQVATNDLIASVHRWMRTSSHWLVVFDNLDDRKLGRKFLPDRHSGHLLLTTQSENVPVWAECPALHLDGWSESEALDFLRQRMGDPLATPDVEAVATQLASELGYLPLALEQAANYCLYTRCSLGEYLRECRELYQQESLFHHPEMGNYPHTMQTAFQMSFERVQRESPVAASLLLHSAFLTQESIPWKSAQDSPNELADALYAALPTTETKRPPLREALAILADTSLIKRDSNNATYRVHPLIRAMLRESLSPEESEAVRQILATIQAGKAAE